MVGWKHVCCVMSSLFLWDGKNYGDSFVTSRKVNESALESIEEGSVFRITSYSVLSVNPPLVFLRDLKFETNVTFVLNTPLSLQTIPRPITMIGFDAYLSSFIRPSIIPDPPKRPSKKRSLPSLSPSSPENSLSLSYEDKRLYILAPPPNLVIFPCRHLSRTTPPPCTPSVFPRFPPH